MTEKDLQIQNLKAENEKLKEELEEYKRLEEQGLLLKLPCSVGDTAYAIRDYRGVKRIQKSIISEMYYMKNMELMIVAKYVGRGKIGEKIFLTEQEAQSALEKMKAGGVNG